MSRQRLLALAALLLLCVLYLGRIGGYPLQDPDEGRYAEIPREMIVTGDWVTPRLYYVKYFEKPPLFYWLTALSFEAFGLSEWSARLVPALSGIAVVVLTFLLGLPLVGRRAAWIGAGVLATMPLFFALSQALLIDMLLTVATTATLGAVYAAHLAEREEGKRRWALVVAAAVAIGVLAKGPIAIVLPGMIALAFLLVRYDFATMRALLRWPPILLFLVVAVPWFVLVSARNPEFLEFFFVREHLQRFLAAAPGRVGHPEGPFYYLPVILFGPAPWTLVALLLGLAAAGRRAFGAIPGDARLLLLLWAGIVVGFFSLSTSKLAPYLLPAFPAMALLLGSWIDRALLEERLAISIVRSLRILFLVLGGVFVVATLVFWPLGPTFAGWIREDPADVAVISRAVAWAGAVLLTTVLAAWLWKPEERGRPAFAIALLVVGLALTLFAALDGRAVVKTSRELADAIKPERQRGDLIVVYKRLMQGLAFYTETRPIQFDAYHEILWGAERAPDRREWFWDDLERLEREWASGRRVFIATDPKHIPFLNAELEPPPRLLVQDQRRVVLVNFPATTRTGEDAVAKGGARPILPDG